MRIVDCHRDVRDGRAALRARVLFERGALPVRDLSFEVPEALSDALDLRGDPFLLAAFVPALEAGEERILVEAEVDPVLHRGVLAAARVLRGWSPAYHLPTIETTIGFRPPASAPAPRTATTLAGGVDSLATIRRNRLEIPAEHPASIRDALLVFGFNTYDFEDGRPVPERERDHARRVERWAPLARESGIDLLLVRTNARTLAPSFRIWARRSMGAALASVAHALRRRITRFLIPSAGNRAVLRVDGTHPAIDPCYSGSSLQVVHDALDLDRLAKLRLLVGWDAAMAVLQPCQLIELPTRTINCGDCNKCRRTMLGLEALGRLRGSTVFPRDEIDAAWVAGIHIARRRDLDYLEPLVPALEAAGRPDLATALRRRLRRFERKQDGFWKGFRRRAAWTAGEEV